MDNSDKSVFQNIKLPSIFMQPFFVDNNQLRCTKCNILCKPMAEDIIFHLTVCNGYLTDALQQKIKTRSKYICFQCSYATKRNYEWKKHLISFDHITSCFNSHLTKYSYDCSMCDFHLYGSKEIILKHQCRPTEISILSELLAYVYGKFDIQNKHMLYFCADCLHYTHDETDLHVNKLCKAAENPVTFLCKSCHIIFYDSSKLFFENHKHTFEHSVLSFLNGEKTSKFPNSTFKKLPLYITKYFELSLALQKFRCIVCDEIRKSSYDRIYDHFISCISSKEISVNDVCPPIKKINCNVCDYKYSSYMEEDMYKCWVNHVISFNHVSNTMVKKNKLKLFTYYCYVSETIFFGTESFMNAQILLTNSDIGRLLFVSNVMANVYQRSNKLEKYNTLYCCGVCLNYHYDQTQHCGHINIGQELKYNCSSCLVEFNVKSDFVEHLLSSEHIILKYFKPNEMGELSIHEHSMKLCANNNDDEDTEKSISSHNQNNSSCDEISELSLSNTSEPQNLYVESCNSFSSTESLEDINIENENIKSSSETSSMILSMQNLEICSDVNVNNILSCLNKLSGTTKKTALNDHLRIQLELLSQMPAAFNVFVQTKAFFCTICNLIFSDQHNWTKHLKEFHSKINELSVFYCSICRIYHISDKYSSNNINYHVNSLEHCVMSEFQKYSTNYVSYPIINSTLNSVSNDDHVLNHEEEKDESNKKSKIINDNKNVYVEIKNVNTSLKGNGYSLLNKLLEEKYGKFKKISNQSSSFIILFPNKEQINNLVNDKSKLEEQHGFKLQVIGDNDDKNKLSPKTKDLLSIWPKLCTVIFSQLESMKIENNCKIQKEVLKLCNSVRNLYVGPDSVKVHIFGSRVYGMASKNSDVDLYLEIGNTFNGKISNDIDKQVEFVKLFAEQCFQKHLEFKDIEEICDARVPIITFFHVPTKLNCDVSFKSGLSLYNSKLIAVYLSMDRTVKWLVCFVVKQWAPENNLKNKNLFTSYALVWLMLFYLMIVKVIPPVTELVKKANKKEYIIIEGWDCTFGKWTDGIKTTNDKRQLLLGFFQFYAKKKVLKKYVLCTFTGELKDKNTFFKSFKMLTEISKIQRAKFIEFKSKIVSSFENYRGLALQDPFELSFNISKNINRDNLTMFCELCDQSALILKKVV